MPVFLEHLEAAARGFVGAGAKGHSRIYLDDKAAGLGVTVAFPGWGYEESSPNRQGLVSLLPFRQPVLFGDCQLGEVEEGALLQGSEPERTGDFCASAVYVWCIIEICT